MNTEAPTTINAEATLDEATKTIMDTLTSSYTRVVAEVKSGTLSRDEALERLVKELTQAYDQFPQFDEDTLANNSTPEDTRPIAELLEEFDKLTMPDYDQAFEEVMLNVEAFRADLEAYTTRLVRLDREGEMINGETMIHGMFMISQYSSLSNNMMAVRAVEKRDGLEDEMIANLRKVKEILRKTVQ